MATAQKLTDHFLTCTICHEVFTDPSTLACGHSFCGQCIVRFTKTKADAIKTKSIPCPFCRRLTSVPNPSRPVEEWAGQMKPSLLLKGLLDTVGPGSKDTTNCNLCHDEGETTSAVSWCSVCDVSLCTSCCKAHRRNPASRHHDVSDMTDEKSMRKREVKCHEHKGELVKFFCKDCQLTLCQTCCILNHRKCESVVTLESMLPEMRSSLESKKETLMEKSRDEEKQLESLKSRFKEQDENKSSIQIQIQLTTQRVIEAAKKKEKELLDELNRVTDEHMDQLKADIKTGGMARDIYRQQSEFIDQALNSESEMDMYELFKSRKSEAEESVGDMKKKGAWSRIELSQDMEQLNKVLTEMSLGEIQVLDEVDPDTSSTHLPYQTVECETEEDRYKPDISDIVCIQVNGIDTLIVTDCKHNCVKSFYERDNQQHYSRLSMQSPPRRIAKLENNKIAVTVPKDNRIAIVSVTPDLTVDSIITTQRKYLGLTALTPSTLATGSNSPPCVDIIDRSGNVMRSLNPLQDGYKIIQKPSFLCTTRLGDILICEGMTKYFICLNPLGDVMFFWSLAQYKPRGVTATSTGQIFVADYGGDSVLELNESGEIVRSILTSKDGISGPEAIHWSEGGRLYVTYFRKDYGDAVQIFTLK